LSSLFKLCWLWTIRSFNEYLIKIVFLALRGIEICVFQKCHIQLEFWVCPLFTKEIYFSFILNILQLNSLLVICLQTGHCSILLWDGFTKFSNWSWFWFWFSPFQIFTDFHATITSNLIHIVSCTLLLLTYLLAHSPSRIEYKNYIALIYI
jgi:hypothetical protein